MKRKNKQNISLQEFLFFMINGKKIFVLILKTSHEELDEVIKIIERTGVPFEREKNHFIFINIV